MSDEPRFAKGDLNGVMAAYPHVAEWVRDFEMRYGSRPIYYGPLDRDAKKQRPLNLIYVTREPIFVHIYEPPADDDGGGTILWFGLEPQLTEEEENIRRELVETLLQEAPTAPSFTTDNEFENILQQMIERYTILDSEANNLVRRQGRLWEMIGMDDKRLTVTQAQRERLNYVVIRDLIRNGPLEPLLSDEMLEDIHSVGLKHIHMDTRCSAWSLPIFGSVSGNFSLVICAPCPSVSAVQFQTINPSLTGCFLTAPVSTSSSLTTFPCSVRRSPFVSSLKRPSR